MDGRISPRAETPEKGKTTTDERTRETFQTRLVNLLLNEIEKGNWVVEWCAALLFFEIWVLLRLGCISRRRKDGDQEGRPAAVVRVNSNTSNQIRSTTLKRFATYRFPSDGELTQRSTKFGRLHEMLLESRNSISQLLESSFTKISDMNGVLKKKFFASKLLYQTENLIAQQSFSRVETVTVKRKFYPNFNRRIAAFNPHASLFQCTVFRRKNRFALKSYTGVHKSLEKSGIVDHINFCQAQMNCFFLEAYMLMSLDHPKIIKAVDVFIIDDLPCIVLELCKGGSLLDEVTQFGALDSIRSRVVLEQLCDALAYLHSLDIVHGDIKLENIMFKDVDRIDSLKLVDFGSVEIQGKAVGHSNTLTSCFGGTLPYQAPEILSGDQNYPTKASECWSVGILMYILLIGDFPFSGDTAEEILQSIRQQVNVVVDSTRIDPSLAGIIKSLFHIDPTMRPSMDEICSDFAGGLSRLMSVLPETGSNDFGI
jgi:hypothetical protein